MTTSILDNPAVSRVQAITATANRAQRLIDESCKTALGVSYLQAVTLCLIDEGHTRPGDLSRTMNMLSQQATGLLDRLEAFGMVKRSRVNPDRRVVHLELTARGQTLAKKARKHIAANEDAIMEAL